MIPRNDKELTSNAESDKPEKRKRRRLRLSCVECTKRRQKCDRNVPCSLCVSRGVTHLCRWSSVPLARPTPARPPSASLLYRGGVDDQDKDTLIKELKARVASLEIELELKTLQNMLSSRTLLSFDPPDAGLNYTDGDGPSIRASSVPSTPPLSTLPQPPLNEHLSFEDANTDILDRVSLDHPLCEAAARISRLAVGHYGEYIGRGCLLFSMLSVNSQDVPRFVYAKSTDPTSGKRESTSKISVMPALNTIHSLLEMLPPMPVVSSLTDYFFSDLNYEYGIPEKWFRSTCSQMWAVVQYPNQYESEVNANWLVLLFAVLASSRCQLQQDMFYGHPVRNGEDYFMCAMMARRVAEDNYLKKPELNTSILNSAADGTVLACFATPLLALYLSGQGRMSEAWKLVGSGIRSAQAVGLHRDPDWPYWQIMSEDEKLLRKRAWWGLLIWDRFHSYILGRPIIIRSEHHDVTLPLPLNPDGSRNLWNSGLNALAGLANLATEVMETCFGIRCPDLSTFIRMDNKLVDWEAQLPPEYGHRPVPNRFRGLTPDEALILARQRYKLHTWYLIVRLKVLITCSILVNPSQMTTPSQEGIERCTSVGLELLQFQCDAYASFVGGSFIGGPGTEYVPGADWCTGCFSLLEASISLIATLAKYSLLDKVAAAEELLGRTIGVLVEFSRDARSAQFVPIAIEMLRSLREQPWWKALVNKSVMPGPRASEIYYAVKTVPEQLPTTMPIPDGLPTHPPSSSGFS